METQAREFLKNHPKRISKGGGRGMVYLVADIEGKIRLSDAGFYYGTNLKKVLESAERKGFIFYNRQTRKKYKTAKAFYNSYNRNQNGTF